MGYHYFLAVAANKVLGFVFVLVLSHLLDPILFGNYALAATNALTVQIVVGSWISSVAYKYLTADDPQELRDIFAAMMFFLLAATAGILLIFAAMAFIAPQDQLLLQIFLTAVWSICLLLYDVTLASLNALGKSDIFTRISLTRGVFVSIFSLVLILAGFGVAGAIIGQIVGTLLPIALRRELISRVGELRPGLAPSINPNAMIIFGIVGAVTLGHYMLINGIARNIIFGQLGAVSNGIWTLAVDLFYAPLALAGTAYSLAQMRDLYRLAVSHDTTGVRGKIEEYVEFSLALALPYALIGPFLASELIAFVAAPGIRAEMMSIAGTAVVYTAALIMFASTTMLLLIFNQKRLLLVACVGTVAANAVATYLTAPNGLAAVANASTAIVTLATFLLCLVSWKNGLFFVRGRKISVMLGASIIAMAVVHGVLQLPIPAAPIWAAMLGGISYLTLAYRWSLINLHVLVSAKSTQQTRT